MKSHVYKNSPHAACIKTYLLTFLSILMWLGVYGVCFAGGMNKPEGFLWYNLPKETNVLKKPKTIALNKLNYQQRTKVLHYYTMEALNKAIATHDVKDVENFLEIQQYWTKEAAIFKHNFQYAILRRPDLDSTVSHPVSAIGEKLNQQRYSSQMNQEIADLTKEYGLIFFYKGRDVYSQKQAPVLASFAASHQFRFISVSVDGNAIESLPNSRMDSGQAKKLNITHFPAIVLVHPKTQQVLPVSNGLVTQDYLTEQLMVVATELKKQRLGEGVFND